MHVFHLVLVISEMGGRRCSVHELLLGVLSRSRPELRAIGMKMVLETKLGHHLERLWLLVRVHRRRLLIAVEGRMHGSRSKALTLVWIVLHLFV